jgi:hypothetical protein
MKSGDGEVFGRASWLVPDFCKWTVGDKDFGAEGPIALVNCWINSVGLLCIWKQLDPGQFLKSLGSAPGSVKCSAELYA